jgi:hypothetical protein
MSADAHVQFWEGFGVRLPWGYFAPLDYGQSKPDKSALRRVCS